MSVTLTDDEVLALAGGLKQPARQLAELKRLGFWRARRLPIIGRVVLERAHYEAVCAGERRASKVQQPQLGNGSVCLAGCNQGHGVVPHRYPIAPAVN